MAHDTMNYDRPAISFEKDGRTVVVDFYERQVSYLYDPDSMVSFDPAAGPITDHNASILSAIIAEAAILTRAAPLPHSPNGSPATRILQAQHAYDQSFQRLCSAAHEFSQEHAFFIAGYALHASDPSGAHDPSRRLAFALADCNGPDTHQLDLHVGELRSLTDPTDHIDVTGSDPRIRHTGLQSDLRALLDTVDDYNLARTSEQTTRDVHDTALAFDADDFMTDVENDNWLISSSFANMAAEAFSLASQNAGRAIKLMQHALAARPLTDGTRLELLARYNHELGQAVPTAHPEPHALEASVPGLPWPRKHYLEVRTAAIRERLVPTLAEGDPPLTITPYLDGRLPTLSVGDDTYIVDVRGNQLRHTDHVDQFLDLDDLGHHLLTAALNARGQADEASVSKYHRIAQALDAAVDSYRVHHAPDADEQQLSYAERIAFANRNRAPTNARGLEPDL